jgi:hypothetical protein
MARRLVMMVMMVMIAMVRFVQCNDAICANKRVRLMAEVGASAGLALADVSDTSSFVVSGTGETKKPVQVNGEEANGRRVPSPNKIASLEGASRSRVWLVKITRDYCGVICGFVQRTKAGALLHWVCRARTTLSAA